MYSYIQNKLTNNIQNFIHKTCLSTVIKNCDTYENENKCLKCKENYILLENKCIQAKNVGFSTCYQMNPVTNKCIECVQGYYLNDSNCIQVIKIENCRKYDTKADYSKCIECSATYYVDRNRNECWFRVNSINIENCTQIDTLTDSCSLCDTGFIITTDGLKCLPEIQSCASYYVSTKYDQKLICKGCQDGYYINQTEQCQMGTVANCQIFKPNSDECVKCLNGYFLDLNSQCTLHTLKDSIPCLSYSNTVDNYCESCGANEIRVTNRNFCRQIVTVITNCKKYSSESTCGECDVGFRVAVDLKSCIPLTITNCEKYIDDNGVEKCVQCAKFVNADGLQIPYILSTDKLSCKMPLQDEYSFCKEVGAYGGVTSCTACSENHYPFNFVTNTRICIAIDEWSLEPNPAINSIPNCQIWDHETKLCTKCTGNYFVEGGICVSECSPANFKFFREIYINKNNNSIIYRRENYCDIPPAQNMVDNCDLYDSSVRSDTNLYEGKVVFGCIRCKTDYLGVIQLDDDKIAGQATNWNADATRSGFGNRFPIYSYCYSKVFIESNLFTPSDSIQNCKLIIKDRKQEKFGCFSCDHGFTGKVVLYKVDDIDNIGAFFNAEYYIESCQPMSTCDSSKFYKALKNPYHNIMQKTNYFKFPMDIYVSCHQCLNSDEIVFYSIALGNQRQNLTPTSPIGGISVWEITKDPPYLVDDISNSNPQNVCAVPNSTLNMPANCAIVIVVSELRNKGYVNGQSEDNSAFKCVSCKAGFKPEYENKKFISNCIEIPNCAEKDFNQCRKCNDGYVFYYSMNHRAVFYTECNRAQNLDADGNPSNEVTNCFAGIPTDTRFYCKQCLPGYYLTNDGYCDKLTIPYCQNQTMFNSFNSQTFYPYETEPFEFLMEYKPSGCFQCDAGYLAVFKQKYQKQRFCIENTILATTGKASSDKFVENCLINYFEDSFNKVRCKQCADNFLLIQGKCLKTDVDPTLLNQVGECQIFNYYTRRCDKCKDYHFLNGGICYKGFLPNCVEYISINKCRKCETGYVPLTLNDSKSICFKISDQFKCDNWSYDAGLVGELECLQCQSGYYSDTHPLRIPPFLCFPIDAVENCAQHDISYSIKISTFNCLRCLDNYYLISNFCLERNLVENCLEYEIKADKCKKCNPGYQLNSSLKCEESLFQEQNESACEIFFAEGQCLKCSPYWYLDTVTGQCKQVESNMRIQNCLYYRQQDECEVCNIGYYLKDEYCSLALAINCETYIDGNTCKTCPASYGLKQVGTRVDCVEIDILNCEKINKTMHPFVCNQCMKNFYLKDNQCLPIDSVIDFCEIYEDANHCAKCEDQRALSEAKEGCFASKYVMSKTDPFCGQAFLRSLPKCEVCEYGRYWSEGKCVKCLTLSPESGCMFCDPQNEYSCLICMPNYYMNDNQNCIRLPSNQPKENNFIGMIEIVLTIAWLYF